MRRLRCAFVPRGCVATALVSTVALLPSPSLAQGLAGRGTVYNVEYHVLYQGTVQRQRGTWVGGSGAVRVGPVSLTISGLTGTLSGGDASVSPSQSVRVSAVHLGLRPASWIELGAEGEARHFETAVATRTWRLVGPTLRLTPAMGAAGLAATAQLSYFPSAAASGDQKIELALRGSVGLSFAPSTFPLLAEVAYRFERFDFSASENVPVRLEEFRGVVASLGIRLGR
jgi:hypothetical protein